MFAARAVAITFASTVSQPKVVSEQYPHPAHPCRCATDRMPMANMLCGMLS